MTADNLFGEQGWTPEQLTKQQGKTFVITGANSGTGFQATRILLAKGARVLMLNRSQVKSDTAIARLKKEFGSNAKVQAVQMDLADLASVRSAADVVMSKVETIDALICNAAIAQIANQEFTKDGFESQLGVNHYGHFLLCALLFERLELSNGRIVVVASEGYKMGLKTMQFADMNWDNNYHPNKTYCHSKLAQMMFAYELQNKLQHSGRATKVYVCHPGASSTSLIDEKASWATRITWATMVKLGLVQSAERGAYPEVMCATEDDLSQRAYYGPTGRMNWTGPVGECHLESFALDREVMLKLWELSQEKTGINWQL